MTRRRLLDLFCKAGGASMGYAMASGTGFEVVGVDIEPQPRYPFQFVQADAFEYLAAHGHEFDFIHASPKCQRNSAMTKGLWKDRLNTHPDQITPLRPMLKATGKPYVMENVVGAPLDVTVMLCGSMFSLSVRRHRIFEANFLIPQPVCNHKTQGRVVQVNGHSGGTSKRDGITFGSVDDWRRAMGIHWMTGAELAQAIPPAYTEYIARFIP